MNEARGKAEVIIAKQRHGPTGTVGLGFQGEFTRFSDLAEDSTCRSGMSSAAAFAIAGRRIVDTPDFAVALPLFAIARSLRAIPWLNPASSSSARIAAPCTRAGPANAMPAASGTRWSRKARRAASAAARPALRIAAQGPAGGADDAFRRHRGRAAHRLRHRRARPRHRRRLRARLGAAGRRRSRHRQVDAADAGGGGAGATRATASSMSRAKRRSRRSGCARSGSAWPTRRSSSPPKPMSRTSWRRSPKASGPTWSSSIPIQTLWTDMADSAPGTVTQVRAAAQAMIRYAKSTGAAIVLVGHVTKEGQIAGPARRRAHGRRGALFRGRRRPPLPHPARR